EDMQEVLWVPGGPLSASLDGSVVLGLADEVEGEVAGDRHVSGTVSGAQAGLILVEGHVEGPVQVVLDGPVASHGLGEGLGGEVARADVAAPLGLDLVGAL